MKKSKSAQSKSSSDLRGVAILIGLVVVAFVGIKLVDSIIGSQAGLGWICVSEFGDDTKGNGGCVRGSNHPDEVDIPYRTITRAQQAGVALGNKEINIAIEGPTYSLREPGKIQVPADTLMRISREPTDSPNEVNIQGALTQFQVFGSLEIARLNFTNLSAISVTANGRGSLASMLNNTFSDNSHTRSFSFSGTNQGIMELESNQISVALGNSWNNYAVHLASSNNGMVTFGNNTITQTQPTKPFGSSNWLAAIAINTTLPGQRYVIENNTFYTDAGSISSGQINKIWGFLLSTDNSTLLDLETNNDFQRFKGTPVKRGGVSFQ